ncbi:MAG: hypothetical protein ABIH53_02930 [archaeon]
MEQEIRFRHLSTPLKVGIVIAILLIAYLLITTRNMGDTITALIELEGQQTDLLDKISDTIWKV